jgi:hypothetical protein
MPWTVCANIPNCFLFDSMNHHWEMFCVPSAQSISLFSPSARGFLVWGTKLEWNQIAPFISHVTHAEGEVSSVEWPALSITLGTNYMGPACKIPRCLFCWRWKSSRNATMWEDVNADIWRCFLGSGISVQRYQKRLDYPEEDGKVRYSNLTYRLFGTLPVCPVWKSY